MPILAGLKVMVALQQCYIFLVLTPMYVAVTVYHCSMAYSVL